MTKSTIPSSMQSYPELHAFVQDADYIDVKQIEGDVTLREFIANMFSYMPAWMRFLYAVRWGFVRLLGMEQTGLPQKVQVDPAAISFVEGEKTSFFEVSKAQEDRYYFAQATESHLTAQLGLVVEPQAGGRNRFHMITIVHYHNWAGPVYFNVIRPFHHLVVDRMIKAAVATPSLQVA